MSNGIDNITEQVGKIGKLSTGLQNTFGINATNGYDQRRNTSNFNVAQAKDSYTINNYDNRSRRDDNKTERDDDDTYLNKRRSRALGSQWDLRGTEAQIREMDTISGNSYGRYGNNYPQYTSRITQRDRNDSEYYNRQYRGGNNFAYNQPAYDNIEGLLTAEETRRGLDNSGLTRRPVDLQDFANDLQAITGRNLTYVKNGQTMLSMDSVAAALAGYTRNRGIDLAALERGDAGAWQALNAALDEDEQALGGRYARNAGNNPVQNLPLDPTLPNQIPAPTKTYAPDDKTSQRIGELIAEELAAIKDPKERAAKAQEISNQIAAALQAKGIKVQRNPIDELSGYIAAEKPTEAEALRNGTKEEAARALRKATGDLDAEATRALTIARINTPQNGQTNNRAVANNNVSNPALEERMLLASLERGESIDKVSDIKKHLNDLLKLKGEQRFKEDDNVNEPRFIATLNQTLKQNLDPRTYNDTLNGGAFTFKGTLELIERNMGNRADVERNRARFEEGFKDGAAKQIIHATLNENGQDGHIKLQQDLRKIGYDKQSLEASLTAYLGDKLYNQGNFRTAPKSVQDFIKDVEAGNYKDGFPLTDPQNAAQMREVVDYVRDSINLDLAKKERGLPVGRVVASSTVAAVQPEQATQPPTTTPTAPAGGATHYERTLGTVVDSSRWAENMFETSKENEKQRLIRDIATASRNNNTEFVNFHKDFAEKNKAAIDAEIKRQNERNEDALKKLAAQEAANKALKVTEQKSPVSENPPSRTAPLTPVEKPQSTTPAQLSKTEAVPSNAPNAELVKGINTIMKNRNVTPEQIAEIKKALESKSYKVEAGQEAEAIAKFVQQNYANKVEDLKRGDTGAAMYIIQELQKQEPAVPTPTNKNPDVPTTIPVNIAQKPQIDNKSLQMALNQFNTEAPPLASTITGGQNVNVNDKDIKVGILPVDMRKTNEVGARI
jgi:anti-sigma28 factor (negative regulator of flagellin synthesis)